MNSITKSAGIMLFTAVVLTLGASGIAAQNGSIEFVAHATPSGGLDEPVRGFPFFLLRESYEDIQKEAAAEFPKPDMNAFVDSLDVSKELKAWMKKNQWVSFSGEDFIHKLKPDDVMNVPEFYAAYMEKNSGDEGSGFPQPKFKESEKTKDPAKYKKDLDQYKEAVHRYLLQAPDSVNGIDLNLADLDPNRKWNEQISKRNPELHRKMMQLAQETYLVAQTQTNLQGQGFFPNIPPGRYWLSTLDVTADIGDARPRWDCEVIVKPGETSYAALTNVNAVQDSPHGSP